MNNDLVKAIKDSAELSDQSMAIVAKTVQSASTMMGDVGAAIHPSRRVFLGILIDNSPSMNEPPSKIEGVIAGQNAMLEAFEGAKIDDKNALMIGQWLFDEGRQDINTWMAFGDPRIQKLTTQTYAPQSGNGTALWDNLSSLLTAILYMAEQAQGFGIIETRCIVAVITDGQDNRSKTYTSATELCPLISELTEKNRRDKEEGVRVIYAGIADAAVSAEQHRRIALELGLDDSNILTVGETAKEIRRTFDLISEQTIQVG